MFNLHFRIMNVITEKKRPIGRLVELDGISYQLIDGKLYRYADLTLDKGFKIVLGSPGSEEILKNLLNRLLGTSIVSLEYRASEYPGMTEDDRASRFDVYCRDRNGAGFVIEMQNWSQKYFNKRAVYYSSLAIQNQAVEELFHLADLAKMTKEQRISLEVSIMSRNDMLNSFRETLEDAKEEAIREGHKEASLEIARKLRISGVDIATIVMATGLSEEEVEKVSL